MAGYARLMKNIRASSKKHSKTNTLSISCWRVSDKLLGLLVMIVGSIFLPWLSTD